MDKLRILHIDSDRTWRGGQQQVVTLMKGLASLGHENLLITPHNSAIQAKVQDGGCRIIPVSMWNEWDLVSAMTISRTIAREKPVIIHAHSSRAHSMGLLARKFARQAIPLVVSRRVDFAMKRNPLNCWKYRNADFYIPISSSIVQKLKRVGVSDDKIRVIYSSIDPERFTQADDSTLRAEFRIPPDHLVVGTIGACEAIKNQWLVIEAAAMILNQNPKVHFFIVGDGPLRRKLSMKVKQFRIEPNVHITGFRSDIGNFLNLFDVFVLVSKQEGLGSVILDAQYFSIPVIATPVGGIVDIIEDNRTGYLVPENDVQRLAEMILDLLKSPEKRKKIGASARAFVETRFSAQTMVSRTVEVYGELLNH